jgi:8-oxo-dGTP pyrophosphatase MutT (NUDIX family)
MNNMNYINNNPNWKPDYRQACGIITTYRGEKPMILVVRRSALEDTCQGLWEVAGGKVDEGETIYWTARTELLEETGLDRSPNYMATDYDCKKKKAYHLFVDAHAIEPEVTLSFEHDAYKWISLGELRQWVQDDPETISHHLAHWVEHCIATDTLHENITYTTMVDGVPFRTWSPASLFF